MSGEDFALVADNNTPGLAGRQGTSLLDQWMSAPGNGATTTGLEGGQQPFQPGTQGDYRPTTYTPEVQVAQANQRWEVQQNRNGLGADAKEINYADPNFQRTLGSLQGETLKINGLPPNVGISTWADDKGFFIWFTNSTEHGRQRMYLPNSFKTIEVNGHRQNVDELKISTAEAMMAEAKGQQQGYYSYSGRTNPIEYGKRLAGIAGQSLALQEKFLRDGIANSPNNPYFHIYLSDILVAKAIQPVLQQIQTGQPLQTNNPQTMAALDEAIKEAKLAQQLSMKGGDLRVVDTQKAPQLNPFALNPYYYNPGMYWGGALYQSWQREVSLTMMKQLIATGILNNLELPPALPPR